MVYLYSSFTGLPDRFFDGYCFLGADFICGNDGMAKFHSVTGNEIPPGEDGCYVTVYRVGESHHIGVDHAGLKKLFIYNAGGVWCFSNSLHDMAVHLRQNGVRLTLNNPQLCAMKIESTITSQMACFKTVFNEIELLPSRTTISITNGAVYRLQAQESSNKNYRESLSVYLETWLRRFETILSAESINISADLTGGTDSRAVFALIQRARARLGCGNVLFRSSTGDHWKADLHAASAIANHYGVTLNSKVAQRSIAPLTARESYENWKRLSLGIYFPIYFPTSTPSYNSIHVHGGGGENHRPFYPVMDPSDFVSGSIKNDHILHQWREELIQSISKLQQLNESVHPLILHYREFRNRMHGGRAPQYSVVLSPLSSRLLEIASNSGCSDVSKVNFDIMESLCGGLSSFDYDKPTKAPSAEVMGNLEIIDISETANPGRVFVGSRNIENTQQSEITHPIELLSLDYERSKTQLVANLFGSGYIEKADAVMASALQAGRLSHASDGKRISKIISASFAFNAAGIE